ncbi:hypothetical protein, partial [Alistipes sp. ZOR0009]|uniref:hypothetical protein n=1 Tax=Alistipes sp. ZOR0009 TaxID=1339253 RepID=UPI0018CDE91A
ANPARKAPIKKAKSDLPPALVGSAAVTGSLAVAAAAVSATAVSAAAGATVSAAGAAAVALMVAPLSLAESSASRGTQLPSLQPCPSMLTFTSKGLSVSAFTFCTKVAEPLK